jgi:hypothetical protein
LVTHDSGEAAVTRWAKNVLLNGREFTKAAVTNGDRLTFARWEVEFLGLEDKPPVCPDATHQRAEAIEPVEPIEAIESRAELLLEQQPPAAATQPDISPIAASTAFSDRHVLQLWTANFQARRRAKALITGLRAARFQADAMAGDLSAMEIELELARAAYDSHLTHETTLSQELAEHHRRTEQQVATLADELAAVRQRMEQAEAELAEQTAECLRLSTELAEAREALPSPINPAADAPLELGASAVEEVLPAAESADPPGDLWAAVTKPSLKEPVPSVIEDSPALEASPDWTVEPIADDQAEASEPPEAAEWPPSDAAGGPSWIVPPDHASASDETFATQTSRTGAVATEDELESAPADALEPLAEDAANGAQETETEAADCPAAVEWTMAEQSAEPEYQPTSFIDKYRHLLQDDGVPLATLARPGTAMLDEEFLSPAKAETCASPADDSEEALEAYMANLMRRVCGGSAPPASGATAEDRVRSPALLPSTSPATLATAAAAEPDPGKESVIDAIEPLDLEALKQAIRRPAPATDLAALREIANNSARTAIASHIQRRSHESAMSKIVVAITATCTSAYLMASAPATNTGLFWVGLGTAAVAAGSALQVILLERRRPKSGVSGAAGK